MPIFLLYVASWLSITGGIYGLFNKAGDLLKEETKNEIAEWLKNVSYSQKIQRWPSFFTKTFDVIFTSRHFSLKCYYRSSIASFISFTIILFILIASTSNPYDAFSDGRFSLLLILMIGNTIPDYLSLYETRIVINYMKRTDSIMDQIIFLSIDLILTTFISFIFVTSALKLYDFWEYSSYDRITDVFLGPTPFSELIIWNLKEYFMALQFKDADIIKTYSTINEYAVVLYSTFFTSIWLWLFAISGIIVKGITKTSKGLVFLQKQLDIDKFPLRSMGFITILIVTLLYIIAVPFILF